MLTVVCWKWRPHKGYRSTFAPDTVNVLRRMVARHYPQPHRFVCVTDDADGIDPDIEIVPLWNDFADIPNPFGHPRNPSCYRRLRMFHPDAAHWFGDRFVSLDLDVVITGGLETLWDRPEEFVIWGDTNPGTLYNASMVLLKAGSRAQVWTDFDPKTSPALTVRARQFGSDQGWISYRLGKGEATWSTKDGVYSFRNQIAHNHNKGELLQCDLPERAKVVFFHGHVDPWADGQRLRWVRQNYQ